MSKLTRSLLAAIAAVVVVLLVVWLMPLYPLEAKGLVLPVEGALSPHLGSVNLYNQYTAPLSYQTIGTINLMYHTSSESLETQQKLLKKAVDMAQLAGGDGVVITLLGHTVGTPDAMAAMILRGKVINRGAAR